MATHHKTINRDGPSMKGTTRDEAGKGAVDTEHKVPFSEAVLKAVGLYGGVVPEKDAKDADEETIESNKRARSIHLKAGRKGPVIRDLRDQPGAIFLPAPKKDECDTPADVIAFLSAKYKGYFERTPSTDSEGAPIVTTRFTYGDGADIVTGSGKTTKAAVKAMAAKLGETFECLEGLSDV
jgi:hypothetical protein